MAENEAFRPTPRERRAEFLQAKLHQLRERRILLGRVNLGLILFGVVALGAAPLAYQYGKYRVTPLAYAAYAIIAFCLSLLRPRAPIDSAISDLENELDLLEIEENSIEQRAEKLFKLHQVELKKYYDQTLQHSSWIFAAGILCIAVGFGIIGVSLFLITNTQIARPIEEKMVTAGLGAVAGILANFIAVIYLKMYSETIKSLTEFHNRLVGTHHLHFGNFLAAKLQEPQLRQETLAEMALKLMK